MLKQLTIEPYGQRAIDEERQHIETAMHEAGDSQDLSTAASLQKELGAWDEAVQSARGKQWDGEALYHAATEGDLAGVLGAIMQGASADDYTSEVSSLVRVNSGGLVDAFSLPPPSRKHVGLSAVPSCVDSPRPNPPLFPPPPLQDGWTALMWAALKGHTAIVEAQPQTSYT